MPDTEEQAPNPKADSGTYRMEGFSDAFFAIVITLLVLDLQPPRSNEDEPLSLQTGLVDIWETALAYTISFVNIYILWVVHHELMRITTRPDTRFLYLNGALLLGIGIMPFSTKVMAEHISSSDANLAAAMYTGAFLWVALFYNLIWRYLTSKPERLIETVRPRDRRRIKNTYTATMILYGVAFAMSWFWPMLSIGLTLALGIFFAVVDRISGFASEDIAA